MKEEVRYDAESYLYSNITCAAMKRHMHAKRRSCFPGSSECQQDSIRRNTRTMLPSVVPSSCCSIYETPSVPMTNPTRLAAIIMRILNTAPIAQTCLYHGLFPYCSSQVRCEKHVLAAMHNEPSMGARCSARAAPG